MDNAYYEDLAGQLYGLLIRLDDRLPREQAQWLHHVTEAGEYGLALEARRRAFLSRWLSSGECAAKFNSPEL